MIVGPDSLDKAGELCRNLRFGSDLRVVCGRKTAKVAGERINDNLNSFGFRSQLIVNDYRASFDAAEKLISSLRSHANGLVAIGGGTNLDLGKYAAHMLRIPLISVPTILSSDALASPYSVLWKDGRSFAVRTVVPRGIIGDMRILKAQPHEHVSAGIGDQLAKVTALHDWKLAHKVDGEPYSEYPAQLAQASLRTLLRNLDGINRMTDLGIEILFYSMVNDGYLMELAGTTRVAAGSEHLFCFALTDLLENTGSHGHFCGIGTIMMSHLQRRNWRRIRALLRRVGAPTGAAEAGVKPTQVVQALTKAHLMRDWYTVLGHNGLSEGAAERLAKQTRVIP